MVPAPLPVSTGLQGGRVSQFSIAVDAGRDLVENRPSCSRRRRRSGVRVVLPSVLEQGPAQVPGPRRHLQRSHRAEHPQGSGQAGGVDHAAMYMTDPLPGQLLDGYRPPAIGASETRLAAEPDQVRGPCSTIWERLGAAAHTTLSAGAAARPRA